MSKQRSASASDSHFTVELQVLKLKELDMHSRQDWRIRENWRSWMNEMGHRDVVVLGLVADDHRSQLDDVAEAIKAANAKGATISVVVFGFDDDIRELWDIPQSMALLRRIIDSDLYLALPIMEHPQAFPSLNASMIYAAVNGLFNRTGQYSINCANFDKDYSSRVAAKQKRQKRQKRKKRKNRRRHRND